MTHDDAFLRDIIENPEDHAPRLIYADWLDDHGQPERAEFIRVQCELARLPERDPRRPELEARERELLKLIEPPGQLLERVRHFLAAQTGFAVDHISLETTLFWDMDIMNEEAGTLLQNFAEEFSVDLPALDLRNHLEGTVMSTSWGCLLVVAVLPFLLLAWGIGLPWGALLPSVCLVFLVGGKLETCDRACHKGPISVRDFVQAAQTKRWPK